MTFRDSGPVTGRYETDGNESRTRHEQSYTEFTVPAASDPVEEHTLSTGTTVVALAATDGVVLAADQKMSLGGRFTANKNAEKMSGSTHRRRWPSRAASDPPRESCRRSVRRRASTSPDAASR